jgi:two-component system cell cycle sensor histidine kinase/response regulator CckA
MTTPSPELPDRPDFQALFESAPGLYLVLTPDLSIVAASDAYLAATMTRREAILGRHLFDVFPDNPGDPGATGVQNLRSSLERVLARRLPDAMAVQKYDIRRPESEGGGFAERHWSPVNSPVLGPDGAITYIIHRVEDVTDFLRLKERGSEQLRLTEELKTRAGQMEAEIYRRAQDLQEANRQLRELQAELEARVQARTEALMAEIAERQRAQDALKASEEYYRLLFDANPQPMWVYDSDTLTFLAVNDAAIRQYGYTREEFLAMSLRDIRPAEDVPALLEDVANTGSHAVKEWRHRRKDGSLIDVQISADRFPFAGWAARLVVATDVSEKRKIEAQLRQSQKLDAIGRLAGGIAHDFNNLLTVILGQAELLKLSVAVSDLDRGRVDEIIGASQRASAMTRQLLTFSRKEMLMPVVLDLNQVVTESTRMLGRLIGEDVELVVVPGANLGRVKADPGQIDQVIMNLAINSRDAMPDGGKLTIETINVELDDTYQRQHPSVTPGHYVLLAITDTGCGMDAATQARIFEPFFTTKEAGKGTGLGLATVYGIVQQSGGFIWLYSEPGRGTCFRIYLPRVDEEAAVGTPPMAPATEDHRGKETVLVVEDEAMVRHLVRDILVDHGYTVLEAASGPEALAFGRQYSGPIHLILSDVIMPGQSGREFVDAIRPLRPDARVVFMSGYTDDAIVRHGILSDGIAFVQKPFSAGALLKKVRETLDGDRRVA